MKKSFKYILISILMFFIFLLSDNIKAYVTDSQAAEALKDYHNEEAAYYCRYNTSGVDDGNYEAIFAISSDLKSAEGYTDEAGAETIQNWKKNMIGGWDGNSEDLGFEAYDYYNNYGCPLVYYEHLYAGEAAHYAINQEQLHDLVETFSISPLGDNVYVLVSGEEDSGSKLTCEYLFSENLVNEYKFTLDITSRGTSSTKNIDAYAGAIATNGQFISPEVRLGTSNINLCPDIYYCKTIKGGSNNSSTATLYSVFYSDYSLYDFSEADCKRVSCKNTDNSYCKPGDVAAQVCPQFNSYDGNIEKYLDEYQNCDEDDFNCKTQTLIKYNQQKKQIGEWCNQIFKGLNYSNPCTLRCLDFNENIEKKENNHGLYGTNEGQCGFSEKLALWIANIVRWGKYLVPVIVIVLGILDFIKAIAADKDDEMKKAQGRFIKRLIAAALIFIIPFIIEFVLVKLGFESNGCGIIDL